ncbi:YkgJ family cysteine cluster protein [Desulfococcaceae bacterium HSG8]|nr:YkgJ family cysteine cluster protein [Desulfococcaceae bacterium HSG8]
MKEKTSPSECTRCGTCCKKGGPAFHHEDMELIEKGIILIKYLYTIRKGEPAYDNVRGCLLPVTSDIIKIKSRKNIRSCIFFDERENNCTIYENRPAECRAMKCWDTQEIESIYSQNRLTRKELLSDIKGLWELVETHESRCDYEKVGNLVNLLDERQEDDAARMLGEMLRYDTDIRSLVVEKSSIDPGMTDFLFGQPLTETIRRFGLSKSQKINDS